MAKVYSKDASKRQAKSRAKFYGLNRTSRCTATKKGVSSPTKRSPEKILSQLQNIKDTPYLLNVFKALQKYNFQYDVMYCNKIELASFFIQNKFMRKFIESYPQYVCLDIFCEIPELDVYVVLLIGLDSNGHCEISAVGLIKTENIQGLSWFCDMFKKFNPSWKKIEFIIADNNIDKDTLLKAFPEKPIFASFYHIMKSFKRELSCIEPSISIQDINKALQIFEKIIYATSESGYTELQKQLKQISTSIFNIFKKNWHTNKGSWALGSFTDSKTVLKSFNSYLLSIRKNLKVPISTQKSMENAIQKICVAVIKKENDYKKFSTIFHDPSTLYEKLQVMKRFSEKLTPFAITLLNEQINLSSKIKNVKRIESSCFSIDEIMVNSNSCCCEFYTLMQLPCSHIFAVRNFLSHPLFVDCPNSPWTLTYYKNTLIDLYSASVEDKYDTNEVIEVKARFQECVEVSYRLWNQILNCPDEVSQERIGLLKNLLKAWKNNFKIEVEVSEKEYCATSSSVQVSENTPFDVFKETYGISLDDIWDSENEFPFISTRSKDESF